MHITATHCHIPLAPSDFHLFGPLKEFLGGQHFSTDDEVKQAILGWFSRTDKSFCAEDFQALVKRWDKITQLSVPTHAQLQYH